MNNCFGSFSIILEIFVSYQEFCLLFFISWRPDENGFLPKETAKFGGRWENGITDPVEEVIGMECVTPTNDFNGQRCLNSTPGTTFEVTMHYLKIKNTMVRNNVKWINKMLPLKYFKLISFNHSLLLHNPFKSIYYV